MISHNDYHTEYTGVVDYRCKIKHYIHDSIKKIDQIRSDKIRKDKIRKDKIRYDKLLTLSHLVLS